MGQIAPFQLPADAVVIKDGHPVTTSLKIAEVFGKKHKDVLDAIRSIDCPEDFGRRNFPPTSYEDSQGRPQPMFQLTRDGLTLLVMGFTGKVAAGFKVAYIEAFNAMEAALRQPCGSQRPTVTVDAQEHENLKLRLELAELKLEKIARDFSPKRRPFTADEKAAMLHLRSQGLGPAAVAARLGRSKDSVESFFWRHGRT